MKYSACEIVRRSIVYSIECQTDWLISMQNCDSEEDIKAKNETKDFIKASKEYYKKRFGESPV